MNRHFIILLLLFLAWLSPEAYGQNEKCLFIKSGEVINDSLTIIPGSVILLPQNNNSFSISEDGKSLQISTEDDSVQVCYQTLSFDLNKKYQHRDLSLYDSQAVFKDPLPEKINHQKLTILDKKDLAHQGSITRGITVGNQQSLTMQSRMNLQLEGKLNDNLNVSAQITDQQVPYLPEGNSQYLRDYDHVSVKLYNDKFSLEAGDQQWVNDSYYGRYARNVEGARLQLHRETEKGISVTTIGGASARGKFSRQQLDVQDGVTGPYRIPRPAASSLVVILPGTEKVFLDGKQLLRGLDNDYIIDYNQGEITFTNEVIITRFSRIIIEFEYTQLSYQQTSIMANHQYTTENYEVFLHYYRQHDNSRQPMGLDLDAIDLSLLTTETPVDGVVYLPGADSIGYHPSLLMYARKDTIINGRSFVTYFYSRDPEVAFYRLSFREVQQGNYIVKDYTAEGRIYEWVAPENGIPQGNYEPVIAVSTPETHQLFTLGGKINTGEYGKLGVEYTASAFEENNLSNTSAASGGALRLYHSGEKQQIIEGYELYHLFELQYIDHEFHSLERIRSVEFDRLWLSSDSVRSNEWLLNGELKLAKSSDEFYSYQVSRRSDTYSRGWLHGINFSEKWNKFTGNGDITFVDSENQLLSSEWLNYNFDINYKAGSWIPGLRVVSEKNQMFLQDSLYASRNAFFERQVYLNHIGAKGQTFNLSYAIREDQLPSNGELQDFTRAHTLTSSGKLKNFDLRLNYRKLEYEGNDAAEEMLSGDVNWRNDLFGKIIAQEIGYGISQGRELRRTFQYMQVMPGEGTHTWRDLDNDNIQDLDEFFEAINIDERNFVKILLPGNDFIPAYESRFSYRGNYQLPNEWRKAEGFKYLLSRIKGMLNYQSERKTSSNDWEERLWLFGNDVENNQLVSDRTMMYGRIYLTRSREKIGGGIGYRDIHRKQWFQAGFQQINRQEWSMDLMYAVTPSIDFLLKGNQTEESLDVGFSERGNYHVKSWLLNPEINYIIGSQWQVSGAYILQNKEATQFSEGYANHREIKVNVKHNRQDTFIGADLRMINIDFEGDENTASGYSLLNAMRPGQNIYWQLNLQQKLSNGLKFSIFYDGRKPDDNKAIHLGRVQLTALF
ncbi:MAG: hypothetical protein ACNS60_08770 [Candidatus Cyclobacteriaceae bacterium M2_1C_046]